MNARNSLIPLALFAVAFVGSIFAMKVANPVAAEPVKGAATARPARVASAAPQPQSKLPPAAESVTSATAAVAERPSPPAPIGGSEALVEAAPAVNPWPTEALQSFTSVEEVVQTLRHSTSAADRLHAVDQLAETARNGVEVSQVRSSLRLAANDESPEVAARAQEEYEKLVEREER